MSALPHWLSPTARADTNAVGASRLSQEIGDRWAAFDALPAEVRAALRSAVVDTCALRVQRRLYGPVRQAVLLAFASGDLSGVTTREEALQTAAYLYVEAFRNAEAGEMEAFSVRHELAHGGPTPAHAALATPIRDSERPPRRSPRQGRVRSRRVA